MAQVDDGLYGQAKLKRELLFFDSNPGAVFKAHKQMPLNEAYRRHEAQPQHTHDKKKKRMIEEKKRGFWCYKEKFYMDNDKKKIAKKATTLINRVVTTRGREDEEDEQDKKAKDGNNKKKASKTEDTKSSLPINRIEHSLRGAFYPRGL